MSLTKLKLLGFVPSLCRQVNVPLPTRFPTCLHAHWVRCVTCWAELSLQNRTLASLDVLQRWQCVSQNPIVQSLARNQPHHLFLFCSSEKQSVHMVASLENSWQINTRTLQASGSPTASLAHGRAASTLLEALVKNTDSQAAFQVRISGWEPRNLYF